MTEEENQTLAQMIADTAALRLLVELLMTNRLRSLPNPIDALDAIGKGFANEIAEMPRNPGNSQETDDHAADLLSLSLENILGNVRRRLARREQQ
ncbi:MAG: hypothetical protein ABL907_20645 [Hyphomicrobium sp.]